MTRDFEGKVALVTGGTSGIGRDTAVLFAKAGAKVVIAGRREAEGHETEELVRTAGGEGLVVKTDVSRAADVEALIKSGVDKFGRVDVAFNNAGVEGAWAPIVRQSEEDWDRTININLKGVWLCLKYEIRQMLKQGGGGAIVNMSSIIGLIGSAGVAAYSASKHGVIGLTKTASLETAKNGIRINAVCPSFAETAMADRIFRAPGVRKFVLSCHPIGRLGKPMEIAEAVVLRARIFHDGPGSGSRRRVPGGTEFFGLEITYSEYWKSPPPISSSVPQGPHVLSTNSSGQSVLAGWKILLEECLAIAAHRTWR